MEQCECCQPQRMLGLPTIATLFPCLPAVWSGNGNNSTKPTVEREHVYHDEVSTKVECYSIIKCLANNKGPLVDEIIVDSGSAFHVINDDDIPPDYRHLIQPLKNPVKCATVNGSITIDKGVVLPIPALDVELLFHITKDSPPLISMGKLCRENGFSAIWINVQDPYLLGPTGTRFTLTVKDEVPLLPMAEHDDTSTACNNYQLNRVPTGSLNKIQHTCSTQTDPVPGSDSSGGVQ